MQAMKKMLRTISGPILGAALLAVPVAAGYKFYRHADLDQLQAELRAENFNVKSITHYGSYGEIEWGDAGESKDPADIIEAHSPVEPETERLAIRARIVRLRNGEATAADRDALLLFAASRAYRGKFSQAP